jgi:hypothetical protein
VNWVFNKIAVVSCAAVSLVIGISVFTSQTLFSSDVAHSQSNSSIGKDQIKQWIQAQSKEKNHYFEHLAFQEVNIDHDDDVEIAATLTGGTNIGSFFIFDKQKNEEYKLIAERKWKIDNLTVQEPATVIQDKKLYQIVYHSGGTGAHTKTVVLWYLDDNGNFVEAWEHPIKEISTFQDEYYAKISTFHIDGDYLYVFSTEYKRPLDSTITPQFTHTATMYKFNGTLFESAE